MPAPHHCPEQRPKPRWQDELFAWAVVLLTVAGALAAAAHGVNLMTGVITVLLLALGAALVIFTLAVVLRLLR